MKKILFILILLALLVSACSSNFGTGDSSYRSNSPSGSNEHSKTVVPAGLEEEAGEGEVVPASLQQLQKSSEVEVRDVAHVAPSHV